MRPVSIIGVPTDFGANRRGVDMGPSAIRYGGLYEGLDAAGVEWRDEGDLRTPRIATAGPREASHGRIRHLEETAEVCSRLAERAGSAFEDGHVPLVLGGDHSIAIGTVGASAQVGPLGAIWFDAHADFNTPATSPSGNIHGMPLAAVLGHGEFRERAWAYAPNLREDRVALVGLRDVDETEAGPLRDSDVTVFTMTDIDRRGMLAVVEDAIAVATGGGDGAIHVSLDLDWLDPNEAPGVGTRVRGGVSYREAHTAMESLAEVVADDGLRSMELVEVNPILDRSNETARLAVELAASAFGKRIL
ncbi:MAG: arginase [Halobacteriales archaeon]